MSKRSKIVSHKVSILTVAVVLLVCVVSASAQSPVAGPDDGLTALERTAIHNEIAQTTREYPGYRGVLIVDSTARNAIFGMYALQSLTQPGWDLFGRTVEWAIDHQDHAATRIWLATYNGTLDPERPGEANGLAAYEYLIDTMGFNPDSIHVASQGTIDNGDFTGYDLVIYVNGYPRNALNVLDQGVPFVTTCIAQAEMMGMGTGEYAIHEMRDLAWVLDADHEITSPNGLGPLDLQGDVWMNATYASGNGVVLVSADSAWYRPPVVIAIDEATAVDFGSTVTIDVTLDSTSWWFDASGFDLLLAFDTSQLEVLSVTQGGLLDSCGWEYFEYRVGTESDCGGEPCPGGLIRLIGVADLVGVPGSPSCNTESTGTLAHIDFLASSDSANNCAVSWIEFIWYDCADNSFASLSGDSLFISDQVYPYGSLDTTFPTPRGTPELCVTDSSTILRQVNYNRGYIRFPCDYPPPDSRGDINLNGIANEIADYVLFTNYLIFGSVVFDYPEAQTEASDVNANQVPLELDDLIYLFRIIIGDALPFPGPPTAPIAPGDTCVIVQDMDAQTVTIEYADSLAAVYLIFGDSIFPVFSLPDHDAGGVFVAPHTKVLVTPTLAPAPIPLFGAGELFTYTGTGHLLSAQVSYDGLITIPVVIEVVGAAGCCLNRGNVDGVSGSGLPIDVSDLTYLVAYMFNGGPLPVCIEEGNVDGITGPGGPIDVADITYLVAYMFAGGPPPPPCP